MGHIMPIRKTKSISLRFIRKAESTSKILAWITPTYTIQGKIAT